MNDPRFIHQPPQSPSSIPRWVWQALTMKLLRQYDRPVFFRVMLYVGALIVLVTGVGMAESGEHDGTTIAFAMFGTALQYVMLAVLYDGAMRRDERSTWREKESKANADRFVAAARADADTFRLGMIEAVATHAMQVQRKIEQNARDVDGEGWKRPGPDAGSDT